MTLEEERAHIIEQANLHIKKLDDIMEEIRNDFAKFRKKIHEDLCGLRS